MGLPGVGDPAPDMTVSQWFNTPIPITLDALRGRVVVIEAFQMLCPGCVAHGIPQALEIASTFRPADVAVLGLHSVFEHHAAMTPTSLEAFLHEYRVGFPVAVDQPADGDPTPVTMSTYGLRGTPSLIVIDQHGIIRAHNFGRTPDLQVGALIGALIAEHQASTHLEPTSTPAAVGCDADGCAAS